MAFVGNRNIDYYVYLRCIYVFYFIRVIVVHERKVKSSEKASRKCAVDTKIIKLHCTDEVERSLLKTAVQLVMHHENLLQERH